MGTLCEFYTFDSPIKVEHPTAAQIVDIIEQTRCSMKQYSSRTDAQDEAIRFMTCQGDESKCPLSEEERRLARHGAN